MMKSVDLEIGWFHVLSCSRQQIYLSKICIRLLLFRGIKETIMNQGTNMEKLSWLTRVSPSNAR